MIDLCTTYIRNKGLRITSQRLKLLEEIANMEQHFDVDFIISIMKKKKIKISRATIYRTLPILQECGVIKEVTQIDNKIFYENVHNKKHHDHMICMKCGRIMEFSNDAIEDLQNKICVDYNFYPRIHRLIIYGTCSDCERSKND